MKFGIAAIILFILFAAWQIAGLMSRAQQERLSKEDERNDD